MKTSGTLTPLIISVLVGLSACTAPPPAPIGPDRAALNKDGYIKFNKMIESGKIENIGDYLTADAIDHDHPPGMPDVVGAENIQKNIESWMSAFSDMKIDVLHLVADSSTLIGHYHWTAKNTGSFMGMPPTGKTISMDGVDILAFKNGKAVEHWGVADYGEMMKQMMPDSAATAPATPAAPDKKKK